MFILTVPLHSAAMAVLLLTATVSGSKKDDREPLIVAWEKDKGPPTRSSDALRPDDTGRKLQKTILVDKQPVLVTFKFFSGSLENRKDEHAHKAWFFQQGATDFVDLEAHEDKKYSWDPVLKEIEEYLKKVWGDHKSGDASISITLASMRYKKYDIDTGDKFFREFKAEQQGVNLRTSVAVNKGGAFYEDMKKGDELTKEQQAKLAKKWEDFQFDKLLPEFGVFVKSKKCPSESLISRYWKSALVYTGVATVFSLGGYFLHSWIYPSQKSSSLTSNIPVITAGAAIAGAGVTYGVTQYLLKPDIESPSTPQKRSSNRRRGADEEEKESSMPIMLIVIVALVLIVGSIAACLFMNRGSPEQGDIEEGFQ